MRLPTAFAALLTLLGCQTAPVPDAEPPVPRPLPATVTANLPAGIAPDAVGLQDRCFIYDDGAEVRAILDDAGRPVCL